MDWPTIKTTLETEVARITGFRTRWAGDPEASGWASGGTAILELVRVDTIGRDELRENGPEGDPTQIQYEVYGNRQIRVQVKLESPDLFAGVTARDALYASLAQCPESTDALALAGINVASRAPGTQVVCCDSSGRRITVAIGDLTFNACVVHVCSLVPTVGTIVIEADVLYPDGLTFALQDAEFTIT